MTEETIELIDRAEVRDGQAIVTYSRTEAAIADLRARFKGATYDLTTTAGDKAARAARLELVTLRTTLEKKRKELKAPAVDFGKKIDSEAARLTVEIETLERPIDAQIKADEKRREDERRAREEAEAARRKTHTDAIAKIAGYVSLATDLTSERIAAGVAYLEALDLGGFEEFTEEAIATRARTVAALQAMQIKAKAREDEEIRLAAERVEQARIAAEQAETARQLREQQEAMERQRAELERQQQAAAAEERRLAAERERIRLEEEAKAQAKVRAEQAEREAAERRQREEDAARAQREANERYLAGADEREQKRQAEIAGAVLMHRAVHGEPADTYLPPTQPSGFAGGGAVGDDEDMVRIVVTAGPAVIPMPTQAPTPPTNEWQPAKTLPKEPADWIEVQTVCTFRFHPYKPGSQEVRRGIRGRWQCANGFGGWENCEAPVGPWRQSAPAGGRQEAA